MKRQSDLDHKNKGYAMVVLLVFVVMSLMLISAAVHVVLIISQETSQEELSQISLRLAETGVEEALLRALRDPTYAGSTLNIGANSVTMAVTGTGIKTIISRATVGSVARQIKVTADFTGSMLSIPNWVVQY